MITVNPADLKPNEFYRYMISTIGPRPIAFASTTDAKGNVNLSPFSFFNLFGYNPPTLIFAPTINRHGHKKHTLLNLEEVGEVVINVVNYAMVEQASLASAEFERDVNEFEKAGFTAISSERVRPPRVVESPAAYECVVRQIINTNPQSAADSPGTGYLVICEVVLAHFQETIFNETGGIDQASVDLVGRLGGDWYSRANADALFTVSRPQMGMGIDQIPSAIRNSAILTGNDLGKLGSFLAMPTREEVHTFRASGILNDLIDEARNGCQYLPDLLHLRAKQLLAENKTKEAWLTLLASQL
ncbi:flavin reductase family protein [Spirosoma foliorum]|uniref:Flavin reductase family protein n=1 Tax=Spirosoma foliorum TaxID=2710596 RepID=A0A7G5GXG0_9BACT|nr:flavin reductase family protein [Spirosoma foliorum]QMW03552.1 flavin reductase family protein [Spirosoma foliorum]